MPHCHYIVFHAPNTSPPPTPREYPPVAVLSRDFPEYVRDLPCIHVPDTSQTFCGDAACDTFLQQYHEVPVVKVPVVEVAEKAAEVEVPAVAEKEDEVEKTTAEVADKQEETETPLPAVPAASKPPRKRRTKTTVS